MNDRQQPYDPYASQEDQLIGYDAYGRPVYGRAPAHPAAPQAPQAPQYDAYGRPYDYGHDPGGPSYDGRQQYPGQPQPAPQNQPPAPGQGAYGGGYLGYGGHDDHGGQDGYGGYESLLAPQAQQPQPALQAQQWIPQQADREPAAPGRPRTPQVPEPRRAGDGDSGDGGADSDGAPDYRTEQFAFLDQPDEDSEDVIDWLKFTESRTERREEARRRGRNRVVTLIVVLALFVVGGTGYLWYAGKLPFLDGPDRKKDAAAAAGPQKRDMIVVHLHNTKKGGTSTALLVDNVTTQKGATVLLPNTLGVPEDDGTATPLGKAVEESGLGVRESLDSVLGTRIGGTWRLDTPFLENLVELVGGIEVDTDTAVTADDAVKAPAVAQGAKQHLSGAMAVAYATHRAQNEPEARQLERLGKVLYGTLRKIPGDPKSATLTVESMGQILDPSLNAQTLGAMLSKLGEHAKEGPSGYRTDVLGVKSDGTLTDDSNKNVVKEVLGGSFTAAQAGTAPRVGLRDATGDEKTQTAAKVALINGGYTFVEGGKAGATQSATQITYQDDAQRAKAVEVAKTLGLAETVVKKGENAVNADVVVTLGKDYKPS
ncbi:LCP family protein [Streptomyces sp. BR123]|uniref:LCP family protein n=1 Tax=Streptomyces sp. BR123 TaxID=2749828 RepID=UPI0015C4A99F|nr:LCP family protein [Streptomyces sp. BR123]NXY97302.1 LCP family protein [Streptomyces sp. BR123]